MYVEPRAVGTGGTLLPFWFCEGNATAKVMSDIIMIKTSVPHPPKKIFRHSYGPVTLLLLVAAWKLNFLCDHQVFWLAHSITGYAPDDCLPNALCCIFYVFILVRYLLQFIHKKRLRILLNHGILWWIFCTRQ